MAMSRASERDTTGYGPSPKVRRRPSITSRCTQDRAPVSLTLKYNPCALSEYRPGSNVFKEAAFSVMFPYQLRHQLHH